MQERLGTPSHSRSSCARAIAGKAVPVLLALSLSITAASPALAELEQAGDAQVIFLVHATGGLTIKGTTKALELRDEGENIIVSVALADLDTGIGLRNKHLRERYLETDRFPKAALRVARKALAMPGQNTGTKDVWAQASLTIHGVTLPVRFVYSTTPEANGHRVTASVRLNFLDFGVKQPSFLGVTVKPEVEVSVGFKVQER